MHTISSLVFVVVLVSVFHGSLAVLRQYQLNKDLFNGIKPHEFTVYDQSGKNMQYRIESHLTVPMSSELVAYPSKKIVANIKGSWDLATLTILDTQTEQWITGKMKNTFSLSKKFKFHIEWNGRQITLMKKMASDQVYFLDSAQGDKILARFAEPMSTTTHFYRLDVVSDELPDSLYLLTLAWRENLHSDKVQKNKKG